MHRTAFNLQQIQIPARERLERVIERARPVIELEDERKLIRVFRHDSGFRKEQEPRVVLTAVFQVLLQDEATIELGSAPTSDCGPRAVT